MLLTYYSINPHQKLCNQLLLLYPHKFSWHCSNASWAQLSLKSNLWSSWPKTDLTDLHGYLWSIVDLLHMILFPIPLQLGMMLKTDKSWLILHLGGWLKVLYQDPDPNRLSIKMSPRPSCISVSPACMYVHHVCAKEARRRVIAPATGVGTVVSCHTVLGTEPESCGRAVSALKGWAISSSEAEYFLLAFSCTAKENQWVTFPKHFQSIISWIHKMQTQIWKAPKEGQMKLVCTVTTHFPI